MAATAENVKVVLRVRPCTSSEVAWRVTDDVPALLQQVDANGTPTVTYGLGAFITLPKTIKMYIH